MLVFVYFPGPGSTSDSKHTRVKPFPWQRYVPPAGTKGPVGPFMSSSGVLWYYGCYPAPTPTITTSTNTTNSTTTKEVCSLPASRNWPLESVRPLDQRNPRLLGSIKKAFKESWRMSAWQSGGVRLWAVTAPLVGENVITDRSNSTPPPLPTHTHYKENHK